LDKVFSSCKGFGISYYMGRMIKFCNGRDAYLNTGVKDFENWFQHKSTFQVANV
jgi:hypothetical protein